MKKQIKLIGYACGVAAGEPGCKDGPLYFRDSVSLKEMQKEAEFEWTAMVEPDLVLVDKYEMVRKVNAELADATFKCYQNHQQFVVIGGDHSSGIGTWSGVYRGLHEKGNLGLIWIDAHLDAHTPETSPTGNIHGMPVASLLGYGDSRLTHISGHAPVLKPENLCMIAMRSYEEGEKALLESLGVRIFYIEEVNERGLAAVFEEARVIVTKNTVGFGISMDLDSLDPIDAPGVGTPVDNGLRLDELCAELRKMDEIKDCLGFEIAEYNPHRCEEKQTKRAICELIRACFHL